MALLMCDNESCKKIFELDKPGKVEKRRFHYCSRQCSATDPKRIERMRNTNVKTYTEHYDEVMSKIRATLNKNHGVDYYSQSDTWKQQVTSGSIERYGTVWPVQSDEVKKQIKETCLERYGVSAATMSPNCVSARCDGFMSGKTIAKRDKTNIERFGVSNPSSLPEIQQKMQETCMTRYGVRHTLQLPQIIARARAAANSPSARTKCLETLKRNKSYGKSAPEDRCYQLLCDRFGVDDIERQSVVNHWPIDFYIKSIDTYVQLDGVYWHGLDRPIEVIAEHKTPRDAMIHHKWLTDREQFQWFKNNNLRLVRITDLELKRDGAKVLEGL